MALPSGLFKLAVKFEFGSDQRYKFYMKLVQLLGNGVSLDNAIKQIENLSRGGSTSIMPSLYRRWYNNIINGQNFGECMAPYVPSSEAILLETGANSGKLVEALQNTAESIAQQSRIKKAIIGATAYPMLLFAMLIGAMLLAAYNIIPTFEEIIPVSEWQGISYTVAKVSEFIRNYSAGIFFVLLLFIVLIIYSLPRWTSKSRVFFDQFVPWSLYKMWQGSSFLLAISSMMSSGVKLDDLSLNRIAKQSDPYLQQRIKAVSRYIISGQNLGEALKNTGYKFPDEEIISDLQIYATLKGFDKNLIWITKSWVESLVERVNVTMKVVNIIILMLIASVIGCLIVAFYDIFDQIQSR
jgi:type II secretory pathway component PulF